ncbi:LuxR C-terminal-related transcriptional regulator [Actinosynnema sp. NPDC051121]|nr:LuxR family transcriptional regulator [Saccharothrix sp.]
MSTVLPFDRTVPAQTRIDALLAAARHEVLVMSTHASPVSHPLGAVRRNDHENLRRGVRYRIIVPDAVRTTPVLGPQLGMLALAGADTRTVADVPTAVMVIDQEVVVLPTEQRVALFRLPSLVTTTVELFERVWDTGVPLGAYDLPVSAELGMRERELLSLLSSGSTDEKAAARLGVSVRTVRRMVSDIMNRLGARSRFQAGAKAADRGWLMERTG